MPEIDENMQFAFNNWANLLNQYIIIIFMKSIFYFYDVHIQEKITMKVEWTEKSDSWFKKRQDSETHESWIGRQLLVITHSYKPLP